MSGIANVPTILLACTNRAEDGKHAAEAVQEMESLAELLHPIEVYNEGMVLQARYGSRRYFTDVLTQKKYKKAVSIVHIMGDDKEEEVLRFRSRSGESQLSAAQLGEALTTFPDLKLVVISGCKGLDFLETLVRAEVAPVLAVSGKDRQSLLYFYEALMDGKTVAEAYQKLAETFPEIFPLEPNWYNPAAQGWSWRSEEVHPEGLWLHQGRGEVLQYQLRNPLLIPLSEERPKLAPPEKKKDPQSEAVEKNDERPPRKPKPARRPPKKTPAPTPDPDLTPAQEPKEEISPKTLKPNPARRPRPTGPDMARSPVRTQRLSDENEKPRKKYLWYGLAAIALLAGLYISWPLMQGFLGLTGPNKDCLFPESEDRFNVLLLPFSDDPNCAGEEVQKRKSLFRQLDRLSDEGHRVSAKFWNLKPCQHTENGLSLIADNCGADLVLWAYPADDPQTGEPTLTFQLIRGNPNFFNPFAGSDTLRIPYHEAQDRSLARPIENLIFWALGDKHVKARRLAEAVESYRRIVTEDKALNALVQSKLAQVYRMAGDYDLARGVYDQLIVSFPEKSQYHYERANLLTKLGKYDTALIDLGTVLKKDPQNTNALISRGVLYREQGDFNAAIADFNQVLAQNPDFSPVYCSRAEVFMELGQTTNALADYNMALRISPDYVGALYGRAKLKHQMGRRQEALSDIRRALDLEPDYTDALLFQGDILLDDKQYNQALLAYTQVLEDYKSARAYLKRGHVYRLLQEHAAALEDLGSAIKLDPTLSEAWRERGISHAGMGQFEAAFNDLDKAIRLAPMDAESYYLRADLYSRLKKDEQALADYEKAISIRPKDGVAYYKQGRLFLEQGRHRQALTAIDQAIKVDPEQAEAYVARGEVYQALGQERLALKDWETALKMDPKQADAFFRIGAYQFERGELILAKANLDRAIQLGTTQFQAYLYRARLYSEEKAFDRALELYSEALRLNPNQPEVYYTRAGYYLRLKQYSKALADFNQGIRLEPPVDQRVYLKRAIAYANLKEPNYNNALIDLSKVIRAYPDSALAYGVRGILYQKMGRSLKAEEDINMALEVEPRSAVSHLYKGILAEMQGKDTAALSAYNRALSYDDLYAEAYSRRGNLLSRLKRFDLALQDLNLAVDLDPTLSDAYLYRGDLYRRTAAYTSAIRDYTLTLKYAPENDEAYYKRGRIYALTEQFEPAIADVKRSLEINPEPGLRYAQLAKIYARQRNTTLFYQYLEMALERNYPPVELIAEPDFHPYRGDRRFEELINDYGAQ
jgi:tetratricopeptide (TPR) repeat protein